MTAYLSKDLMASVTESRAPVTARRQRFFIVSNGRRLPLMGLSDTGFSVDADAAGWLRGLVELYEGDALIGWCLVCSAGVEKDLHRFEFKRMTRCDATAPVDFERPSPEEATAP